MSGARTPITKAMVLAAGLGTRMRPITETLPKPLVRVAGRPLIDYALEALAGAGISEIVVNVHYRASQIVDHLAAHTDLAVAISDETEQLLDSGGGVVKALPLLGEAPFLLLNADTFWIEDPHAARSNLQRLIDRFDAESSDMEMLVVRPGAATGYDGKRSGDFLLDGERRPRRYDGVSPDPVIYAGALVLHPRLLADAPAGPFSLGRCFDAAIAEGRLHCTELAGHWITVGTPAAIGEAEAAMARYRAASERAGAA